MRYYLLSAFAFFISTTAISQAGSLVAGFGTSGKLTTSFGTGSSANAIAVQSDGKIILGGSANVGGNYNFALARYTTAGALDASFSGDGKQTTAFGAISNQINAIALQGDGKIVAVGNTTISGSDVDFAIARYNTDGTLDVSFDGDGKASTSLTSGIDYAYAVAIQTDGKIVVAGTSQTYDFAVARYNADGSLDNSFSGDGKLTTDFGASNEEGRALFLQADGKIIVGGFSGTFFALARYNSDGSLDTNFDTDGKVTAAIGASGNSRIMGLALQNDGKIVAVGTNMNWVYNWMTDMNEAVYDVALARFNSSGSLDNTFDTDGKLITDLGYTDDMATAIAIQNDGKIVVAGSSNYRFALQRYSASGALDNTFDGDGKVVTSFASNAYAYALKLSGNVIYAAGSDVNNGFALAAYQNDATPLILPVKYRLFSVRLQGNDGQLAWVTTEEINASHIAVERSVDGRSFVSIGSLPAAGTSASEKQYQFFDRNVSFLGVQLVYYRLKMVDIDGKYSYSKTVLLPLDETGSLIRLYPNPAKDHATLLVSAKQNESAAYRITDYSGRILLTRALVLNPGSNAIDLPLEGLAPGVYTIQLRGQTILHVIPFIRQ